MKIEREYRPEVILQVFPENTPLKVVPEYIHFMVVWDDDDQPVGCYVLVPHSDICVFIHTYFKKEGYRYCVQFSLPLILDYVFNVVKWRKLLTEVPVFNTLARKLAIRAGMVKEGYWKEAFKDSNGIHDVEIFGLTEKEFKCQHSRT